MAFAAIKGQADSLAMSSLDVTGKTESSVITSLLMSGQTVISNMAPMVETGQEGYSQADTNTELGCIPENKVNLPSHIT